MAQLIAEFHDKENNVSAFVNKTSKGFSVVAKDMDADAFLPFGKIYPFTMPDAEAKAIAYAKTITPC